LAPSKLLFLCNTKLLILFELILKAVVTGLILSVMIGPALFMLLETSIKKGVRAALSFDLGILVSDLIYITIAYLFYAEVAALLEGDKVYILKIIGGFLFMIYGILSLVKKSKVRTQEEIENFTTSKKDYLVQFLKGLMLNLTNPMVIFYWFSVVAVSEKHGADELSDTILFLGIILGVYFSIDILKIFGAKKLRPHITDKFLCSMNRFTGAVLLLFAIVLLYQGFLEK
jgi:threonine/homoserine/homoserine lactone efflux protein